MIIMLQFNRSLLIDNKTRDYQICLAYSLKLSFCNVLVRDFQYHISGSPKLWEHIKFWRDFRFSYTGTERYCILQLMCSIRKNSWLNKFWNERHGLRKRKVTEKHCVLFFLYPFLVKMMKKKYSISAYFILYQSGSTYLKKSIMTCSKIISGVRKVWISFSTYI